MHTPLQTTTCPFLRQRIEAGRLLLAAVFLLSSLHVLAQPVLVKKISKQARYFTEGNQKLYFAANDSLFVSDGTPDGTYLVKKTDEVIQSIFEKTLNNQVFFVTQSGAGHSLWKTTGTAASTIKLVSYPSIVPQVVLGNELYLTINDGTNGVELWKLSASGTPTLVRDVNPGIGNGVLGPLIVSDNAVYFKGTADGTDADIWKSDGTSSGTTVAVDLEFSDFNSLTDVNGTIFFVREYYGDYEQYAELWKTDGTTETTQLLKFFEYQDYYNNLSNLIASGGKLFFIHAYGIPAEDLWVSDGTPAGTKLLRSVNLDGSLVDIVAVNNKIAFKTQSQGFPGPVWVSDGTSEGTSILYNSNYSYYDAYDYGDLTAVGEKLFFIDNGTLPGQTQTSADTQQVFESDLTTGGTRQLRQLYGTSFTVTKELAEVDDRLFFTVRAPDGLRLYLYDPYNVSTCAGLGSIMRETWNNVRGTTVSTIPVGTAPTSTRYESFFEGPQNAGDHYGSRFRGYFCPPQAGSYRFMIASNDNGELWLSTSDDPAAKVKIAFVNGGTNPHQYTKYASQKSALIQLNKGQRYYIEALQKEGVNNDHISVAVTFPSGETQDPIAGAHLIPFLPNQPPTVTLTSPEFGREFDSPATISISADASDQDGTISRVSFYYKSVRYSYEYLIGDDLTAPYSIDFNNVYEGEYIIVARAFDDRDNSSESEEVLVRVTTCAAEGFALREVWRGVQGTRVTDIPLMAAPHEAGYIDILEGPSNIGIHYGTRIRAYLCPPVTGEYVFFVASNDNSEVYISSDGDPANKIKVASIVGGTAPRQWDRFTSQRSAPIQLQRNRRVYIEVLHKQGVGTDNIAVGWMLPDGTLERPIPGSRMSPFRPGLLAASAEEAQLVTPEVSFSVSVAPNPVSPASTVSLSIEGLDDQPHQVKVELITTLGQVLSSEQKSFNGVENEFTLTIPNTAERGIYLLRGTADGRPFIKRLLVR